MFGKGLHLLKYKRAKQQVQQEIIALKLQGQVRASMLWENEGQAEMPFFDGNDYAEMIANLEEWQWTVKYLWKQIYTQIDMIQECYVDLAHLDCFFYLPTGYFWGFQSIVIQYEGHQLWKRPLRYATGVKNEDTLRKPIFLIQRFVFYPLLCWVGKFFTQKCVIMVMVHYVPHRPHSNTSFSSILIQINFIGLLM